LLSVLTLQGQREQAALIQQLNRNIKKLNWVVEALIDNSPEFNVFPAIMYPPTDDANSYRPKEYTPEEMRRAVSWRLQWAPTYTPTSDTKMDVTVRMLVSTKIPKPPQNEITAFNITLNLTSQTDHTGEETYKFNSFHVEVNRPEQHEDITVFVKNLNTDECVEIAKEEVGSGGGRVKTFRITGLVNDPTAILLANDSQLDFNVLEKIEANDVDPDEDFGDDRDEDSHHNPGDKQSLDEQASDDDFSDEDYAMPSYKIHKLFAIMYDREGRLVELNYLPLPLTVQSLTDNA
jgi:hypothetical protein